MLRSLVGSEMCIRDRIYNEQMFDLIDNIGKSDHLQIVDDHKGGVHVKGLTHVEVSNEEEVLNHFFRGEMNRSVAKHSLNEESSRSHAIFTLHIEAQSRIESSEKVILSKLNLVDLAGSERVKKTDTEGAGLEEAKFINRSLTYLEQCVVAATDRGREHIPFRQTKLTNILRDSIGGNSATLLVANIWAEREHLEETLSTCRFAARMMRVVNTPSQNVHQDPGQLLVKYERDIRQLKQELVMHDTLSGRSRINYDEYTDSEKAALRDEVEGYLTGTVENIELVNLRQMREILSCTRKIFGDMKGKVEQELRDQYTLSEKGAGKGGEARERADGNMGDAMQSDQGFSVGQAPDNAKPKDSPGLPSAAAKGQSRQDDREEGQTEGVAEAEGLDKTVALEPAGFRKRIPRSEAYEVFKAQSGSLMQSEVNAMQRQLIQAKREVKERGDGCNANKAKIDTMNRLLDTKRLEEHSKDRDQDTYVIDEEEYDAMRTIKECKADYRIQFDKLRSGKATVEALTASIRNSKEELLSSFDEWFLTQYGPEPVVTREKEPNSAPVIGAGGDVLDPDEAFEHLEQQRIMDKDPDSFAFTMATKKVKGEMNSMSGRPRGAAMRARNRKA
eukprot:TRINITY_DN18285_c0_g1_i1.p1 TRINITY_DN18285_c0_g1~~TRINITY_DN18285_c0_g1_i1.p1  ORF type:complete len:617 (+),score=189.16 TRINITY_DN18285_c0_g1_i1:159-2009(+)